MTSILEEFAYGNISPEIQFGRQNPEYEQAVRILSVNEERLLTELNEKEKILFQKYIDAQGELNRLTAVGNLIHGYKLGLTMTAEAFTGMDALFIGGKGC